MRKKIIIIILILSLTLGYALMYYTALIELDKRHAKEIDRRLSYNDQITVNVHNSRSYDIGQFIKSISEMNRYNWFIEEYCAVGVEFEYKKITLMLKENEKIPANIIWKNSKEDVRIGVVLGQRNSSVYKRGETEYIVINGSEYEVIGYFEERSDEDIYLFLNGMDEEEEKDILKKIAFSYMTFNLCAASSEDGEDRDSIENTMFEDIISQMDFECEIVDAGANVETMTLFDVFFEVENRIIYLLIAFCVVNSIMVLGVWMNEHRKEFVIKSVFGWKNSLTVLESVKSLLTVHLLSCLFGIAGGSLIAYRSTSLYLRYTDYLLSFGIEALCVAANLLVFAVILSGFLKKLVPADELGGRE